MATIEIISIDGTETAVINKITTVVATATVKVTIGSEEFVQQIRGVPTKTTTAARDYLTAYANDYEKGLLAARAAEAGTTVVPDIPIADLVGKSLP